MKHDLMAANAALTTAASPQPNGEPVSVGQPSGEVVRGASEPVQDVRP